MSLYLSDLLQKDYNSLCEKFHKALFNSPDRREAQLYLKKRGITRDLVEKFKIGWCPLGAKVRESLERLKGRLIFPTIDEYGDVRSFSGRMLVDKEDVKGSEKRWWNESYEKSFFLYGLDAAALNIIKKNKVIIVEGQTDVIACHKYGFDIAVALMSDDLNLHQISKLLRFTNNFILMLDGDEAGRESSKNIRLKRFVTEKTKGFRLRGAGVNFISVYDVDLYTGGNEYDPDSFLSKYGADGLKLKLNNSIKKQKKNRTGDSHG